VSAGYREIHARSLRDAEDFWGEIAEDVHWIRRWDRVLDKTRAPFFRWFPGALVNSCYNALDRHVEGGRGDQLALIYDSPVTDVRASYSYRELLRSVGRLSGALRRLGVGKGDRVLVYMPNIPEAVMAMLACARIGAVHSVVFGGFAANELATRIDDARPKVVLAASCGIEVKRVVDYKPLLDRALELAAFQPERCLILQRPQRRVELSPGRDLDWEEVVAGAPLADCEAVAATDPLYILYTSGTTGIPKGVVRDNGGHLVALKWSMKSVYGADPGDVYWAASDVGWVVGHSYIVYAPLFHGCTSILYEGKPVATPDAGAFWRVISEYAVRILFTAPTAFRAIRREDPNAELVKHWDLSCFKALFLAGERADPDTVEWAERALGVPVIDHWWQTESGWAMAANCLGIGRAPVKRGSPSLPVPGFDLRVLDGTGEELPAGEMGSMAVKLPLPPGCLPTLWENDRGYLDSYLSRFDGYYDTSDAGYLDEDGYVWIMSRTDDIINVAGHRLSTGGMEEVLASHPDVAECAVIGVADAIKGQVPVGLVVLESGASRSESDVAAELVQMVRERLGPVAAFRKACVVQRLPKTRSGKVLRDTMRRIADSLEYRVPATIDDPAVLGEIEVALKGLGLGRGSSGA
jgi:propionyl-CoA synthetase